MRKNVIFYLTVLGMFCVGFTALADDSLLMKKLPEHPDWYQQLQKPMRIQANVFTPINPKTAQNYSVMTIDTKPFTHIILNGKFQVTIIGDSSKSGVKLVGNEADVFNTKVTTQGDQLILSERNSLQHPVSVHIATNHIEQLTVNGNNQVNAKNLNGQHTALINNGNNLVFATGEGNFKSIQLNGAGAVHITHAEADAGSVVNHGKGNMVLQGNLALKNIDNVSAGNIYVYGLNSKGVDINSKGKGNLFLQGFANLHQLIHQGTGNIYFYWVNSDHATVTATGSGVIGLAGQVKNMIVKMHGNVVYDGRFLRADNLEVTAQGNSRAKVIANNQLTAAAKDKSQIYYYNKPKKVLKYHADSGVVLSFP